MQFNVVALTLAAMATVVAGDYGYGYETSTSTTVTTVYGVASSTAYGVAYPTVASTGVVTAPTPTGSPITYVTGAASLNGVSAFGMIVAGGVALFL